MLGDDGVSAVLQDVDSVAGAIALVQSEERAANVFSALVADTVTSPALRLLAFAASEAGHPWVSKDVVEGIPCVGIGVEHPGDQVSDSCRKEKRKPVNQ